jgi:hypothetical protein
MRGLEPGYPVSSLPLLFTLDFIFYTEDGNNRVMRNIGDSQPDYTVSRSRRQVVFVVKSQQYTQP